MTIPDAPESTFYIRRRDAASYLAVSLSQLLKWERNGVLTPITIPGLKAKRYLASDVRSLAANIARGRLSTDN